MYVIKLLSFVAITTAQHIETTICVNSFSGALNVNKRKWYLEKNPEKCPRRRKPPGKMPRRKKPPRKIAPGKKTPRKKAPGEYGLST